jgi:hypothetical protein
MKRAPEKNGKQPEYEPIKLKGRKFYFKGKQGRNLIFATQIGDETLTFYGAGMYYVGEYRSRFVNGRQLLIETESEEA